MKRKYYDLYIKTKTYEINICEKILIYLKNTKFKGFSIPIVLDNNHRKIYAYEKKFIEKCKKYSDRYDIDFVTRLDLRFIKSSHIKKALRKYRRDFEIISVLGKNREILSFISRDHRVDIITYYPSKNFRLLKGDIEYIRDQNKIIEFLISFLRYSETSIKLSYRVMRYRENIENLYRKKIPHIFSSGLYYDEIVHHPLYFIDFYKLLGIKEDLLIKSMSETVGNLIVKNRKKLSQKIILPGVELINEQK